MDILLEEHKKVILLLLKHNVDFLIIGGYAVIFHGYARATMDMDLWLKPDNKNKEKLISALREHKVLEEDLKFLQEHDFESTIAFHIGEEPNKIDFLTKVAGVTFDEADEQKVFFPLKDKYVPVIQYHHLLTTKLMSGRPRDKVDVDELQKINKYKNKK